MNTALRIAIDEAFFRARKALDAPTEAFPWLERVHHFEPATACSSCSESLADAEGWLAVARLSGDAQPNTANHGGPAVLKDLGAAR